MFVEAVYRDVSKSPNQKPSSSSRPAAALKPTTRGN
jgi:hypothetical protein